MRKQVSAVVIIGEMAARSGQTVKADDKLLHKEVLGQPGGREGCSSVVEGLPGSGFCHSAAAEMERKKR